MLPEEPAVRDRSRAEALLLLAPVHSLALRLRDARLPDPLIAECLGIEPEALGPLLDIAAAKLAAVLARWPAESSRRASTP